MPIIFNRKQLKIPIKKDENSSYYKNLKEALNSNSTDQGLKSTSEITSTIVDIG
jgi:hypothetical protein